MHQRMTGDKNKGVSQRMLATIVELLLVGPGIKTLKSAVMYGVRNIPRRGRTQWMSGCVRWNPRT